MIVLFIFFTTIIILLIIIIFDLQIINKKPINDLVDYTIYDINKTYMNNITNKKRLVNLILNDEKNEIDIQENDQHIVQQNE